ncbi:response regulator transcription factor [Phenylobacterium sp.]|uniref:response regulator transcription factor n=1 Tax=Phenylobacterium sp. TaxID=1871053 RepID=UPI0035B3C06A
MPGNCCVHIVDDDVEVLKSLAFALGLAGYGTRIYTSGADLLADPALDPGCIVTDVRMAGLDGVELVRRLRAAGITLPIIVVSGHADVAVAVEAMKAGANDFLQKPFRPARLAEVIERLVSASTSEPPPEPAQVSGWRAALAVLSPRQNQVLRGVVAGKLNKTIAQEMGISVRTVEGYRAEIMAKTQARNVPELVRMVTLAGL